MKTSELLAYFGGQTKAAIALGVRQPSVARWAEYPPELRQLQAEALTWGKLKAEPACDKFRVAAV